MNIIVLYWLHFVDFFFGYLTVLHTIRCPTGHYKFVLQICRQTPGNQSQTWMLLMPLTGGWSVWKTASTSTSCCASLCLSQRSHGETFPQFDPFSWDHKSMFQWKSLTGFGHQLPFQACHALCSYQLFLLQPPLYRGVSLLKLVWATVLHLSLFIYESLIITACYI